MNRSLARRCVASAFALAAAALLLSPAPADAAPKEKTAAAAGWTTDLQQARQASKATGRPIVADFTGSDWCGYCIKLKKDVLDTADFQGWAAKNVVLLEVDFPQAKAQSKELKAQNNQLKEHYKVGGFPTIVVFTEDGTELGRIGGYGDAKQWSAQLQEIVKKAPAKGSEKTEKTVEKTEKQAK